MERALGDPGVAIRGHGALPGCPHGGPVPSASPTQAGIRGDSSVGAGFGRLSPLLCTTRETLASMAGMSRQPGTKTQSSRALRHPQAAPAVSAACQSEAFLFILTRLTCIFPPPALPKPPGSAGRSEALGCLGSASEPYPEEFGRQGMGREESDPDPSRSPTGAERGASRGLLPLLPPARRPGERGAAPRVPPDSSAAVEAPAGSSLSRVRKGQPCPPRRRPAGSWERAGALCRGVLTPASSSSSSPRAGGRLGAVLRAGGWVC